MDMVAIDRAVELWAAIVTSAGLDLKLYDREVLVEVATNLSDSTTRTSSVSRRAGISAQLLLEMVLLSIAPYGSMLSEVLAFDSRVAGSS
jgi:hypothetical protein